MGCKELNGHLAEMHTRMCRKSVISIDRCHSAHESKLTRKSILRFCIMILAACLIFPVNDNSSDEFHLTDFDACLAS